jgi:hypothetical protein
MNLKIEEIVVELRHESIMLRGYEGYVCWTAADLIEQLQQELIDERYRHDRLQDFCVAQGEELAEYKRRLHAVIALLNGDENLVVTGLPEEANIQCK